MQAVVIAKPCTAVNAYGQRCTRLEGHKGAHLVVNSLGEYKWLGRHGA